MTSNGRTDRHEEADSRFPRTSRKRAINYTTGSLPGTLTITDRDKMDTRKKNTHKIFVWRVLHETWKIILKCTLLKYSVNMRNTSR